MLNVNVIRLEYGYDYEMTSVRHVNNDYAFYAFFVHYILSAKIYTNIQK